MGALPFPPLFESLDYLYLPAPEVETAITFYTDVLGGKLLCRARGVDKRGLRLRRDRPLMSLACLRLLLVIFTDFSRLK